MLLFCIGALSAHACAPDFHSDVDESVALYDCDADHGDTSSGDLCDDCDCVNCACACHGNIYFSDFDLSKYRQVSDGGHIAMRDDVGRSAFLKMLMRPPRA